MKLSSALCLLLSSSFAEEESCGCSGLDRAEFDSSTIAKPTCDGSAAVAAKPNDEFENKMVFVQGGTFHMGLDKALIPAVCVIIVAISCD
jgi:hypothetical protein